jgi:cutinase
MNCRKVLARMGVPLAAAAVLSTALAVSPGRALADGGPDVEVVFARGTGEPPGIGRVGQSFVDTLIPQLGGRTVGTYAVDYPASVNFLTTATGATNAAGHLAFMAGQCPGTREVLGGFSQGGAVVSMLAGVPPLGNTVGLLGSAPPLAPPLADRVAAAAVFGSPSARFGTPLSTAGQFAGRTIDLCSVDDPVCSLGGRSREAHNGYEFPPFNQEAAGFVAGLLS